MAGIGFRIQKILAEDTYTGSLKAYFYAAAISAGPWLFTILSVGLLGFFSATHLSVTDHDTFRAMVVYSYAFSLILTGAFQMVVTRYLSDRFFSLDEDAVLPTYMIVLLLATLFNTAVGTVFYGFSTLPMQIRVLGVVLFAVVSNIWLAMVFLTALRDFKAIFRAFIAGMAVSILLGIGLCAVRGLFGLVLGFTLGQGLILALLTRAVFAEFRYVKSLNREFFHYFSRYPQLVLIGLCYNLAIWIDKFLFWFLSPGERIRDNFFFCPVYDSALYIAFLAIVPSLSLFLIRIETSFYNHYRDFYGAITLRQPLSVIREKKALLVDSLNLSIQRLLRLQGVFTLALILLAPYLVNAFGLEWRQVPLLRVGLLGTFLHVLLLILTIIILYFDFRNLCLFVTALFLGTVTSFTIVTIRLGYAWYGYGYTAACLVTLVIGFLLFARKLRDLEYLTFMQQPVLSRKKEDASQGLE
ncbi:MAG: exopolysaccharide Pel transporter PelG [Fibrobacterota bacterium]